MKPGINCPMSRCQGILMLVRGKIICQSCETEWQTDTNWKIVVSSLECPWNNEFIGCVHGRKHMMEDGKRCSEDRCPIKVATMCQDCKMEGE